MDGQVLILIIVAVVVLAIIWKVYAEKKRREYLTAKYNNPQTVEMIMARKIWQGMTSEQLHDSWGSPAAKDHRVYKSKTAETFKYNQTGKNRFVSRVMLEDGIVVGWKQNG